MCDSVKFEYVVGIGYFGQSLECWFIRLYVLRVSMYHIHSVML